MKSNDIAGRITEYFFDTPLTIYEMGGLDLLEKASSRVHRGLQNEVTVVGFTFGRQKASKNYRYYFDSEEDMIKFQLTYV